MKNLESMKLINQRIRPFYPLSFFVLGFIYDLWTLRRVDQISDLLILALFLFGAMFIMAMEMNRQKGLASFNWVPVKFWNFSEDILHFFFGAHLSAFTIFYFKSASLTNQWIFLLLLIILLVANEIAFFKKFGQIIRFSLLTLIILSFFHLIIPLLIGHVGFFVFLIATIVSIGVLSSYFYLLFKFTILSREELRVIFKPVFLINVIFILLYIFQIFPPVPISLKHVGVYHDVKKINGGYELSYVRPSWKFWQESEKVFLARPGDKIFIFTQIFAPVRFEDTVQLRWLTRLGSGDWEQSDVIPLQVKGGRDEGFRGFTYKQNFAPGEWQVRIETQDGREIGRSYFEVEADNSNEERQFYSRKAI